MCAPGIVNQQVAYSMWPHGFAMHAVMVVDLQVAIEGRFPPGARQIAFGIEMPIVQRLIRELVRKFTQPLAEFKCLARGQTDKDDAALSSQASSVRPMLALSTSPKVSSP